MLNVRTRAAGVPVVNIALPRGGACSPAAARRLAIGAGVASVAALMLAVSGPGGALWAATALVALALLGLLVAHRSLADHERRAGRSPAMDDRHRGIAPGTAAKSRLFPAGYHQGLFHQCTGEASSSLRGPNHCRVGARYPRGSA